jgi:hypothetical protein
VFAFESVNVPAPPCVKLVTLVPEPLLITPDSVMLPAVLNVTRFKPLATLVIPPARVNVPPLAAPIVLAVFNVIAPP